MSFTAWQAKSWPHQMNHWAAKPKRGGEHLLTQLPWVPRTITSFSLLTGIWAIHLQRSEKGLTLKQRAKKLVSGPWQYKKVLGGFQEDAEARHAPLEDPPHVPPAGKPRLRGSPLSASDWHQRTPMCEHRRSERFPDAHQRMDTECPFPADLTPGFTLRSWEGPVLSWWLCLWIFTDSGLPKAPSRREKSSQMSCPLFYFALCPPSPTPLSI